MGARYAYLCPPWWAGGWRVTIGVPLSESIQVRVGVLRLGGEAAVRVRTRRVRGLGALVEWVGPQRLPRRPVGWRRIPCRRGSQKLLRRPPGGGGAHPPCARARQAAAPPRGPSATAPPGPPGPESHAPARSGRGLPPPASRENRWVGDIHLHPHPGRDPIRLATAPGLLHEEGSRVRDRGDNTRHRPLVCEAIDTAARRRPTRRDDIPLRPGAQDAGRGQPGAPSNKTSSLRHNFQGCPRHSWQPMHSTFRRTGELFMECSE